jgi:hypothetical protein
MTCWEGLSVGVENQKRRPHSEFIGRCLAKVLELNMTLQGGAGSHEPQRASVNEYVGTQLAFSSFFATTNQTSRSQPKEQSTKCQHQSEDSKDDCSGSRYRVWFPINVSEPIYDVPKQKHVFPFKPAIVGLILGIELAAICSRWGLCETNIAMSAPFNRRSEDVYIIIAGLELHDLGELYLLPRQRNRSPHYLAVRLFSSDESIPIPNVPRRWPRLERDGEDRVCRFEWTHHLSPTNNLRML